MPTSFSIEEKYFKVTFEDAAIREISEEPIVKYLNLLRGVVGPLGQPVDVLFRKRTCGVCILRLVGHFVRTHLSTEKSGQQVSLSLSMESRPTYLMHSPWFLPSQSHKLLSKSHGLHLDQESFPTNVNTSVPGAIYYIGLTIYCKILEI